MSINNSYVPVKMHQVILSKFPEDWRERLKAYTAEELFYFYKLLTMEAVQDKETLVVKNIFFLGLKAKFNRWIKDEVIRYKRDSVPGKAHPIYGDAWIKLNYKFKKEFEKHLSEYLEEELAVTQEAIRVKEIELAIWQLSNKKENFNSKRLA